LKKGRQTPLAKTRKLDAFARKLFFTSRRGVGVRRQVRFAKIFDMRDVPWRELRAECSRAIGENERAGRSLKFGAFHMMLEPTLGRVPGANESDLAWPGHRKLRAAE